MALIPILVDSFADAELRNAQMSNAREIVARLDPDRFLVSMFLAGSPDPRIASRPNTRLLKLPRRGQTVPILKEFFAGEHEILFYVKASPASRCYLGLRDKFRRAKFKPQRITIALLESLADLKNEPTIAPAEIRLWENTVLRCDFLFSNSRSVQRSAQIEYNLRSEIIPTGVDTRFFIPLNRMPNPRPRVFFAGSLRPFKQPQFLVEAAGRFPQADFRIAGDGPLAAELKMKAADLPTKNLALLGMLSADDLRNEYQNADIFLFPSRWEGSPKVILEAAACGLPVIARKDYSPETVSHGITGYLSNSDDEMFTHLKALVDNSELRQQMGRNGRSLSKTYDWDAITRQWEEVFIRVTQGRYVRKSS
jgi:glycosyltransferase involved in cell wall biosynthesis